MNTENFWHSKLKDLIAGVVVLISLFVIIWQLSGSDRGVTDSDSTFQSLIKGHVSGLGFDQIKHKSVLSGRSEGTERKVTENAALSLADGRHPYATMRAFKRKLSHFRARLNAALFYSKRVLAQHVVTKSTEITESTIAWKIETVLDSVRCLKERETRTLAVEKQCDVHRLPSLLHALGIQLESLVQANGIDSVFEDHLRLLIEQRKEKSLAIVLLALDELPNVTADELLLRVQQGVDTYFLPKGGGEFSFGQL